MNILYYAITGNATPNCKQQRCIDNSFYSMRSQVKSSCSIPLVGVIRLHLRSIFFTTNKFRAHLLYCSINRVYYTGRNTAV